MNRFNLFSTAVVMIVSVLPLAASASDFDGSKPLTCTSIWSSECRAEDQKCIGGAPWMNNFPVFMEIDFKAKKVSTTKAHKNPRVSAINHVGHLQGGHTAVLGVDGDLAWSMMIAEDIGSFTLAASGEYTGFVVFGACHVR